MGSVCFSYFWGSNSGLMLIGWHATNMSSMSSGEGRRTLFVRTLISRTNAFAGCSRPTLNAVERFVLGRSVPPAKPLHLASVGRHQNRMYKDFITSQKCFVTKDPFS